MNHHHRDLRRSDIRTSLQPHIGRSPTDPATIDRLAVEVYRQGRGIYFSPEQLKQMNWTTRDLIEGEARRICERGNRR